MWRRKNWIKLRWVTFVSLQCPITLNHRSFKVRPKRPRSAEYLITILTYLTRMCLNIQFRKIFSPITTSQLLLIWTGLTCQFKDNQSLVKCFSCASLHVRLSSQPRICKRHQAWLLIGFSSRSAWQRNIKHKRKIEPLKLTVWVCWKLEKISTNRHYIRVLYCVLPSLSWRVRHCTSAHAHIVWKSQSVQVCLIRAPN